MKHSPIQTIFFLAPLLAFMYLLPKLESNEEVVEAVKEIPTWSELLEVDTVEIVDSDSLVYSPHIDTATIDKESFDSVTINLNRWSPSYAQYNSVTIADSLVLEGYDTALSKLHNFFSKLESISESDTEPVEVFHWGDSQIEGDRITGLLRSSWQKSWGGHGPGLVPAVQPIPALSIRQSNSGNWKRHTRFGITDSTITHNAFGPMAAFCMTEGSGGVYFTPHPSGFKLNKKWTRAKFLIGGAPLGGNMTISGNKTANRVFSIKPTKSGEHKEIVAYLGEDESDLSVEFEGYNLEVTGIELGSDYGIQVHNIPMRGSAGLIFTKVASQHFANSIASRNVGLVVLQFGGNVVPYISSEKSADLYGRNFRRQLNFLKSILPDAAIIVIGPSDMGAHNEEGSTYPMLETVIKSLRKSVIEADCLFWDLNQAMGGQGTMEIWAQSNPRLASSDLIHFTPKGARLVGELFDTALRAEYKSWVEWKH